MGKRKKHVEEQELPVKLTAVEIEAHMRAVCAADQKQLELEDKKKVATASLNAELKELKLDRGKRLKSINSGEELRKVQVEKRLDYDAKLVHWVRLDTEQTVQTLPMDPFDQQLELDDEDLLPSPKKRQPRKPKAAPVEAAPEAESTDGDFERVPGETPYTNAPRGAN